LGGSEGYFGRLAQQMVVACVNDVPADARCEGRLRQVILAEVAQESSPIPAIEKQKSPDAAPGHFIASRFNQFCARFLNT